MKIYILFNLKADVLSKWLSFYIFDDLAVYQQLTHLPFWNNQYILSILIEDKFRWLVYI